MFAVFGEHSSADALLMFNTGPEHGEAVGSYRGDPLYHASLAPAEYVALVNGIGFEVSDHAANDVRVGGRTVWLCRSRANPSIEKAAGNITSGLPGSKFTRTKTDSQVPGL